MEDQEDRAERMGRKPIFQSKQASVGRVKTRVRGAQNCGRAAIQGGSPSCNPCLTQRQALSVPGLVLEADIPRWMMFWYPCKMPPCVFIAGRWRKGSSELRLRSLAA